MTFSIVAFDPETNQIGSAIASKWPAVGGCVQFFEPSVAMMNVQNFAHPEVAHNILYKMRDGLAPDEAIKAGLAEDTQGGKRQCLGVTIHGHLFVHSGDECTDNYHQVISESCVAAGNTLLTTDVVEVMVSAYETATDIPFAERLLIALEAGQEAGGDARGQGSASLKVLHTGYPRQHTYPLDLRVDDHTAPITELKRLYKIFCQNELGLVE